MTDSTARGGRLTVDARGAREALLPATDVKPPRRSGFDPWFLFAALAFGIALVAAGYPAFVAAPQTGPGLLLLFGLSGVGFLALFALRPESERKAGAELDALIEALEEPAAVAASDGRILACNRAWREVGGTAPRLPRGKSAPAMFAAMAAARNGRPGRALLRLGEQEFEAMVSGIGPGRFLVRAAAEGVLAEPLLLAYSPEPVEAATAQAAPEDRHRKDAYAAGAPFGAAAVDHDDPFDGVIIQANTTLEALAPERAKPGLRFADLFTQAGVDEAREKIAKGANGPFDLELALDPPHAAKLYLSWDSGRRLVYVIDVSQQRQLELQIAQAGKMQAIGQLAGGVAHDFNNLLTAIQLRLDVLLQRHPVGDPSYGDLMETRQLGVRAADLVRNLLAFSRKQTVQRRTLDLGELISEFEVMLRRMLREDTRLDTEYGRDLPGVRVDKSQLENAVMNLALNARDAMKAQGGGMVRIKTARVSAAEAHAMGWAEAPKQGDCALIEVSDTGPGVPSDLRQKIFEPFFTTKALGEGTGLGLATVYGIVEQADGCVVLDEAKPGHGATFRIFLPAYAAPAIEAPAPQPAATAAPVRSAARDLSGAGKILFVEDEDRVRDIAARLLRERGYEVIEASDGEEALALAEEHSGGIDMMISDVIMPGMDGPSLLKLARKYLGAAPVMFISGYAEAEFSDLLEGEANISFLPKPLDIKTLAERVKEELRAA
ncbi:MAG TPA: response regulator [Caulobacteraceae bacterium]|nr:response regulator [Caulobacteraceae bacterium]